MAAAELALAMRLAGQTAEAEKRLRGHWTRCPPALCARRTMDNPDHTGKVGASNAPQVLSDWAKPYPPTAEPFLQVAAWYRSLG